MIIVLVVFVIVFNIGGTLTATPEELARIDAATKNQNVCISAEGEDNCVDHVHFK